MKKFGFFLMFLIIFMPAAQAVEPSEVLADPALESRARSLSAEIRCLVCQNQSIDDSDAPLARDLGRNFGNFMIFMKTRPNQNMAVKRPLWTRSNSRFHRSLVKSELC